MTNPTLPDEPGPIRLHLLGGIELRAADGGEVTKVLAQPKRLALLAHLAMAPAGRPRRRDSLIGLLWPDADETSARNSLNRSISFLRGALGADAITSRGRDEVGVSPEQVWCDVAAFEAALAADDLQRAVDLYRGDLLDGFVLTGASEFENWVSRERTRLRQRACNAAWTLAARAEDSGDIDTAMLRARHAVELDLLDEPALRRLLGLLDRLGDRLGAARVYADFVRLLEREFEMQPSPETTALMHAVRSRVRAHSPASTVVDARGDDAGVPAADPYETAGDVAVPPPAGSPAAPVRSRNARRWRPAAASAAVLVLLMATAFVSWPRTGALRGPADGPETVLVLPFTHSGDGDVEFLGTAAASILSANLLLPGVIASIDPRAMHAYLGRHAVDVRSANGVGAAAAHFHARYVVAGEVSAIGGRLRIDAAILDMADGGRRLISIPLQGSVADAFDLFDQLSHELIAALPGSPGSPGTELRRSAARSTSSHAALRAYLEGERLYRQGRFAEALEAYQAAMREDTTFALAHYRFSVTGDWTGGTVPGQGAALSRALRHTGRLPEQERLLIQAWGAFRSHQPAQAETLYRRLLRNQPHHVEAWYRLGEVHFHQGHVLGRSYRFAREAFERAHAHDPRDVGALLHLARIAAAEGMRGNFDTLFMQLQRLADDRTLADIELLRACAFGNETERARAVAAVLSHGPQRAVNAIRLLAAHSPDLAAAGELAAAHARMVPHVSNEELALRAMIELARGRPDEMRRVLSVRPEHPDLELRGLALALPWMPADEREMDAVRRELLASRERPGRVATPRRIFLEGLLAVRAGDRHMAALIITVLDEARDLQQPFIDNARYYARILTAAALAAEDRPAEALAALESSYAPGLAPTVFSYPPSIARYLRAMLLARVGRHEDALMWFATFPEADGSDVAFRAAAHYEQARIHEALGDRRQAARQMASAAALLRDAEPPVRNAFPALFTPADVVLR